MATISIHQPAYLPWLGFFEKIIHSETFVFLDDVQYEKNGWQNRNKIRTREGEIWLTVPVKAKLGTLLNEIKIENQSNWSKKHSKTIIQNYSKSKFFKNFWPEFEAIYQNKFEFLTDLNFEIIKFLINKFKIKTKIISSSELNITKSGSDRILEICKSLDADTYYSGIIGKSYLDTDKFTANDIKIEYQNFCHPKYNQVFEPFYPNMAAIDLLFNEGDNSNMMLTTT